VIKKYKNNYNKFLATYNETLQTCFETLGEPWHHEIYKYNHKELAPYKKQYKKNVARNANLVTSAFPKPSKKKNAPVKPSCFIKGKGTLNAQKKKMKKATKALTKVLEKNTNYCS